MDTSYDQVPYRGLPFAQTHPNRLATLATLHGMNPAPVDRCRVLELGCGDGGNLIPMACDLPNGSFVGFDLAETHIKIGLESIRDLGLKNIRLEQGDILKLGDEIGEFDYIIAHGVYSWVPEPVRDSLLAICRERLSPQGVAYVSYNALPGCHVRFMIRDMLLYHLQDVTGPKDRLNGAQALLRTMLSAPVSKETLTLAFVKEEMRALFDRDPAVLFHDELGDVYFPIAFEAFMSHAARHGLQYLTEADYYETQVLRFPSEVIDQIEKYSNGQRVRREQYIDFLKCRKFRQTLLCHAALPIPPDALLDRVRGLYASSNAQAVSTAPDLTGPTAEEFRGPHGAAMKTAHPLAKLAIGCLIEAWPSALHFEQLLRKTSDLTGGEQDPTSLADILSATHRAGLAELHVHPPACTSIVSEQPSTTPLARWQAVHSQAVTTLRHTTVEAKGDLERHLLMLLDGTRDRAVLLREMAKSPGAAALDRSQLEAGLDANLEKLGRFGLLRS